MSFCQTRNRSTQSSKVEMRVAGMVCDPPRSSIVRRRSARAKSLPIRSRPRFLPALKFRRAFFEKRAKRFAAIFGAETFHLCPNFEFQGALELLAVFGEQDLFDGANRERWSLSNLRGQRARFGGQMGCGHDAIHDANPQGGLRVNQVSGVKHFRGA